LVNEGLTSVLASMPPVQSQMDGPNPIRDFATCEVKELPLLNPDVQIPDREDLMTRVLPIGWLRFSHYFGTSHIASIDAKALIHQLTKPQNEIYMGDPTTLVGSDPTVRFSQDCTSKNDYHNFPAPLQDLTTSGTLRILHGGF
jgi:hypothetical protein